jgi:DNA repair protein RecO (recombination protein O)
MPLDQSEAIVLRTSPIGDQDKIVIFFCREKGIVRGVAKGARKFGNRFGSCLEPMSVVEIFYYEKEHRDLVTVSACDLVESFFEVQTEPDTAFLLSYLAELIEEFSPPHAKDEILFRLLHSILKSLKDGGDQRFLAAYFEAWVLHLNGFLPDLGKCRKCRKSVREAWLSARKDGCYCPDCAPQKKEEVPAEIHDFLHWIKKNPPPVRGETPLAPDEVARIRKSLQAMIIFHLEREPRTLRYLK